LNDLKPKRPKGYKLNATHIITEMIFDNERTYEYSFALDASGQKW
jgi:hypothetical protein